MKVFLATLVLSVLPYWAATAVASCDDVKVEKKVNCEVIIDKDGGAHQVKVIKGGGVALDGAAFVVVNKDGDVETKTIKLGGPGEMHVLRKLGGAEESGGYLGVSVGEVPDVLSAQFDLDGRGVLVLNVVDDSPADEAGMRRHDVIVSVDGKTVDGDVGGLVDLIRAHDPGDEVAIGVLRGGKEHTLGVTLGAREEAGEVEWKFEFAPDEEIEESISTRGLMLMKDKDGNWVTKDFRDLGGDLELVLPKVGSLHSKLFLDGERKTIKKTIQEDDGTSITITQEDDGEITVVRKNADGEEVVVTYSDEDALNADDEEAGKLLMHGKHGVFSIGVGDLGELHDLEMDVEDLGDLEIQLDGVGEQIREALKHVGELKDLNIDVDVEGMPGIQWWSKDEDEPSGPHAILQHLSKPKHTFHANADGSIDVRIRRGDSELIRHYDDAADLARRSPKLSKKYEALMELGEDD